MNCLVFTTSQKSKKNILFLNKNENRNKLIIWKLYIYPDRIKIILFHNFYFPFLQFSSIIKLSFFDIQLICFIILKIVKLYQD